MTIARLSVIPCIQVDQVSETNLRITAADGFRLDVRKVDRMEGPYWAFDNNPPSAVCHFNLRYKIHKALNPRKEI